MKKRAFHKLLLWLTCVLMLASCVAKDSDSSHNNNPSIDDNSSNIEDTTPQSYFVFTEVDGGYAITGLRKIPADGKVNIPSTYKGKKVIEIGINAFASYSTLTSIVIPNSITNIGKSAFQYCSSLVLVTFEEESKLESIGDYTFYSCSSLTSIIIPNNVTSIGNSAFSYCSLLKSIIIPKSVTSIRNYAFFNCSSLPSIIIPSSVTSIGENTFSWCDSLTIYCEASSEPSGWNSNWNDSDRPVYWGINEKNYLVQDGIIYVITDGNAVATGYTSELSNYVVIPETIIINGITYCVTSIGADAFYKCSFLTSVTFEEGSRLTNIGNTAFSSCSSLTSIVIPSSVTSIGTWAFRDCSSLTSVTFEEGSKLESIGADAFYNCSSLTSIVIPSSVISIGTWAFSNCSSLSIYCGALSEPAGWNSDWNCDDRPVYWGINKNNYLVQDGLIYIIVDGNAIITWHTIKLTKYMVIPATIIINGTIYNVKSIGKHAFYNCRSLTSVGFEEGSKLTSIGDYAFYDCSFLTSIVIPNSVTSIGNSAFRGCSSLTFVTFEEESNLESIEYGAFYECSSLTSIVIPNSVTSIGDSTFLGCSFLTSVTFEEGSKLESIGADAFYYCSSLTSITIPNSVIGIGEYAFSNCSSLTSITIPNSVISIGRYAFSWCYSLTVYCGALSEPAGWDSSWNDSYRPVYWGINENNYLVQDGIIYVITDGNAVVTGHTNDLSDNVVIPETITINGTSFSVTSIGDSAFDSCDSLTSIVIPSSVTKIGSSAFFDCSSLTSITFEEESKLISIGDSAFWCCSSLNSLVIPNSVTSIGSWVFSYCSSLTFIVIPSSVISIGTYAFSCCSSLTIYCETSSEPSGWDSYWNDSSRSVYWAGEWSYVNGVPTPN